MTTKRVVRGTLDLIRRRGADRWSSVGGIHQPYFCADIFDRALGIGPGVADLTLHWTSGQHTGAPLEVELLYPTEPEIDPDLTLLIHRPAGPLLLAPEKHAVVTVEERPGWWQICDYYPAAARLMEALLKESGTQSKLALRVWWS